jgi:hypothetical protein
MKRSNGKPLLDSVMVDGSAFPLEENINWTARMASYAHQRGVVVEAELGRLAGEEDGLSIPEVEAKMTDPDVVEEFLTRTQVLAPSLSLVSCLPLSSVPAFLLIAPSGRYAGGYHRECPREILPSACLGFPEIASHPKSR